MPRARRTKTGLAVIAMASIAFSSAGPRNAASAIARIRKGTDSMASAMRDSTASTHPPTNPASSPSGTPMSTAPSTETTPAISEARAPQMRRESTSRPFSSVPSGCAQEGGLRMRDQLVSIGSYGATQGARMATSTKASTTTSPNTASLWRRKRRAARRAGLSPRSGATGAEVALMQCGASD